MMVNTSATELLGDRALSHHSFYPLEVDLVSQVKEPAATSTNNNFYQYIRRRNNVPNTVDKKPFAELLFKSTFSLSI